MHFSRRLLTALYLGYVKQLKVIIANVMFLRILIGFCAVLSGAIDSAYVINGAATSL